MSLYKKSWCFVAWMLAVFFTFPLWMSMLVKVFGKTGLFIGAIFWLGHGAASMFLFRCPVCGLSPFLSRKGFFAWSTPWPRKVCGHCKHNHTVDD